VLILPTQVRSKMPVASSPQPAAGKRPAAPAAAPKFNKDTGRIATTPGEQTSVPAPTTPALNK
jgi:hypothetical protein